MSNIAQGCHGGGTAGEQNRTEQKRERELWVKMDRLKQVVR